MTTTTHHADRPGATLTAAGLGVAVLGLVLFIMGINGPIAVPALLLVLGGLALAGVGFAKRVLAALEHRGDR